MKLLLTLCWIFICAPLALAEEAPKPVDPAQAAAREKMQKLVEGLQFEQGKIVLPGGLATVNVPEGFRFLNGKDAETVLTKLWGNPPDRARPLGLIVPVAGDSPHASLFGRDSWAVIVEYEEDGYVKDDDASKINYSDLLKEMQTGVRGESEARVKDGYDSIELIGWATAPHYDAVAKKLYWAKEIQFGQTKEHTLNYNIRMLGRRGVLVLNAVAGIDQLAEIEKAAPSILSMVEFQDGHRYSDFQTGDKMATYGLAGLIAGGVLAKAGFFKVLIGALLVGKKFVIVGVIALFGILTKCFSKKDVV